MIAAETAGMIIRRSARSLPTQDYLPIVVGCCGQRVVRLITPILRPKTARCFFPCMRTAAGIADREQNQLAAPVYKAIEGIDERSAEFLQRSISLTEDTFLNMLDYAEQLVRATERQELAQVQTDFVNRQSPDCRRLQIKLESLDRP
jgi:hypothetical protein